MLLALVMVLSMVACGAKEEAETQDPVAGQEAEAGKENTDAASVVNTLNKKSGYIGFFKESSDARDLRKAQAEGNELADLIINIQEKKVVDFIGSYYAYMGGVDVITFTGGIGENSPTIREDILTNLSYLGIKLNKDINDTARGTEAEITLPGCPVRAFVVPTNEELAIARDAYKIIKDLI